MQAAERATDGRLGLVLAGTGVVSSATARFFFDGGSDRLPLVMGYAIYLLLLVLSLRPARWRIAAAAILVLAQGAWAVGTPGLAGVVLAAAALAYAMLAARDRWRAGVALLWLACIVASVDRHLSVASIGIAPDDVALVVVTIAILAALVPFAFRRREAIALLSCFTFYALVGIALVAAKPYDVDPPAIPHRAVEHLLAGEQPYRAIDAQEALARFGIPLEQGTRLEDGTFLHSLNYPALALLVPAPLVALGLADLRYLYLAELLVLAALVVSRTRARWRPAVAAALVGNVVVMRQEVLAGTDPLWALLIAVAWLYRDRRIVSPIALGLAAAARQPAWVVAPFVLLATARADGWREAARRAAIAAAAFILPNLPFFVTDPQAYLDGVLAPLVAPLVANGVGLVAFALYGPLPLFPRGVFAALTAAALVGLLAVLWRSEGRPRGPVLLFPLLVLYVAWRSLQNYFAFGGLFAIVGDDEIAPAERPAHSA